MADFDNTGASRTPKFMDPSEAPGVNIDPGPYIGVVKNNVDPMRRGRVQVWIPEIGGGQDDPSAWRTVTYASPFFGVTPAAILENNEADWRPEGQNFATNPHSYGFWMTPPDLDVRVICTFIMGDPDKGFWFACVPEWPNMYMVPGIAGPVVDYNDEWDDPSAIDTFHEAQKPKHDVIAQQYSTQGLQGDLGPISSTAFRESPSRVFGFSTPGLPQAGPKDGKGRKGGHSFVLDDGDMNGKSQFVRIRTATGNQIMMHDNGKFIHIIPSHGNSWFELDGGGNINGWAKGNINLKADGVMQLEAGNAIKMKSKTIDILGEQTTKVTGKGGLELNSDKLAKLSGKDGLHLKGKNTYVTGDSCLQINGGSHADIAAGCVTINSKKVTKAKAAAAAGATSNMPTHEPYKGRQSAGAGAGLAGGLAGIPTNPNTGGAGDIIGGTTPGMSGGGVTATIGGAGAGLTADKQAAILAFADKYNINPNAMLGLFSVESNFSTSIQGGANSNYSGIFQLEHTQIPGLTSQALGTSLTPEQYRALPIGDQLKVYEQYITNAGATPESFTGDAATDSAKLWTLQLAPSKFNTMDYNNPDAVISATKQAGIISPNGVLGTVTVGSAAGSLQRGGYLPGTDPNDPDQYANQTVGNGDGYVAVGSDGDADKTIAGVNKDGVAKSDDWDDNTNWKNTPEANGGGDDWTEAGGSTAPGANDGANDGWVVPTGNVNPEAGGSTAPTTPTTPSRDEDWGDVADREEASSDYKPDDNATTDAGWEADMGSGGIVSQQDAYKAALGGETSYYQKPDGTVVKVEPGDGKTAAPGDTEGIGGPAETKTSAVGGGPKTGSAGSGSSKGSGKTPSNVKKPESSTKPSC